MSKLNNKSNFELNVLVAMLEHPKLAEVGDEKISERFDGAAVFDLFHLGPKYMLSTYNYTGDWGQMGPIIEREGIDIEWPEKHLGGVGQATKYLQGDTDITVEFEKKEDGLRTAAICYLMMKAES